MLVLVGYLMFLLQSFDREVDIEDIRIPSLEMVIHFLFP